MLDEDGLRGGGVWGLLVRMGLSLSWPASLSSSLPLRGGVLFSELSELEPESAHIRSRSTSDAEEGRNGEENDAAKGLDRRDSDIYFGARRLGRRNRKSRGFKPVNSSVGDWRVDEEARRAKSVDDVGREGLGRWGVFDITKLVGELVKGTTERQAPSGTSASNVHNRTALQFWGFETAHYS